MKDEIKEIREYISCPQFGDDHYGKWGALRLDQRIKIKQLLDYITNLQEKVNQYENPDDMTLFYMWLDEKAKDKIKQLQEENKKQEELISRLYNIIDDDKENFKLLEQENEKLKEDIKDACIVIEKLKKLKEGE